MSDDGGHLLWYLIVADNLALLGFHMDEHAGQMACVLASENNVKSLGFFLADSLESSALKALKSG